MDEQLISFLNRGYLFSGYSNFSREVKLLPVKGFRFFTRCVWDRQNNSPVYFGQDLRNLIGQYLSAWLKLVKLDTERPMDHEKWKTFSFSLASLTLSLKEQELEIYNKVVSGDEIVEIEISPNNSKLLIRRVGDILAFDVTHMASNKSEHKTGVQALESLCRAFDAANNQGIYELVRSMEVSFLLFKEPTKNGGSEGVVDFESTWNTLKNFTPYVEWDFHPEALVKSYIEKKSAGALVGKYFGLNVRARLFHGDAANDPNNIGSENFLPWQSARVWRKGNVEKKDGGKYLFRMADDLKIALSIESSLPAGTYFEGVDPDFKTGREQFLLSVAGSIFSSGICSMLSHLTRKRSIELGN